MELSVIILPTDEKQGRNKEAYARLNTDNTVIGGELSRSYVQVELRLSKKASTPAPVHLPRIFID